LPPATETLRRTPLFDRHQAAGGRLVPFAGWEMPVQYDGIRQEHVAVRTDAGKFDVSHMGEVATSGPDAERFLQRVLSNDVSKLAVGGAQYSVLCREDGGVLDDLFTYRLGDDRYLTVTNAANHERDFAWLAEHAQALDVEVRDVAADHAMIALQGPRARAVLDEHLEGEAPVRMRAVSARVAGVDCLVCGTGYTGEDGVELLIPPDAATTVWDALEVAPAGLGARDTLRLEPCLSLYGNEIDETTNPIEANLSWVVKLAKPMFVGKEALEKVKAAPLPRKLVGFEVMGRGIARHGYPLRDESGKEVGVCTSGSPGPTVGKNIGLGYLPSEMTAVGTKFLVDCRGKNVEAVVVKTPFYKRAT
jgi:aminomethyltransferase